MSKYKAKKNDQLQKIPEFNYRQNGSILLGILFFAVTHLVASSQILAQSYDPIWSSKSEFNAMSLENRRGPDPRQRLAPINLSLGSPGGRLETDGGAYSGNYNLSVPLINLPGRGIDLSLVMFYNSQIWSQFGWQGRKLLIGFNADGDWPASGMSLGFGKLVLGDEGMLIEPDGTRRPIGPTNHEYVGGRFTGRATAKFTDGSGDLVECLKVNSLCDRLKVRLRDGGYALFTKSNFVTYYPDFISDVHGNFIKIDYARDQTGTLNPPFIDRITDTVGRIVQFHYDSRKLLVAISGPDIESSTRIYVRFTYRFINIGNQYQFFALEGVFFPGNNTGYVFEDFTGYGIPRIVSFNRNMGLSTESLTEQGTIQKGLMTRKSFFNYPHPSSNIGDFSVSFRRLPYYTSRTDSWVDPVTGRESQATTQYSKTENTFSTIYQNGSEMVQTINDDPKQWNYGLTASTESKGADGKLISGTYYIWEQGFDRVPRLKEARFVKHEIGAGRRVRFYYGANNLQVVEEDYTDLVPISQLDYAQTPTIMRKKTSFLQRSEYIDNGFNLPREREIVFDGVSNGELNTLVFEKTSFEYDSHPVQSLGLDLSPPINNYGRVSAFPNGPRGNLTRVTRYLGRLGGTLVGSDNRTKPIETKYFYDETGNLRKVLSAGSQTATTYEFDAQTQYSLPTEISVGANDPKSNVRTKQKIIWDVGLGLPKVITDADGNDTVLTYQPAGYDWRVYSSKLPTGIETRYSYDDARLSLTARLGMVNMMPTEVGGRSSRFSIHQEKSFRYDGRGLLRETQDKRLEEGGAYISEYEYDEMGRLKIENLPRRQNEGPPKSVQYSYDPAGRIASRIEPDGSKTQWVHNSATMIIPNALRGVLGETVMIQDPWARQTWMKFDSFGKIRYVVEPNATTGKVTSKGGQLTEYRYDILGRLTKIEKGQQVTSFRYDSLSRLTHAKYPERNATLDDDGVYSSGRVSWSDVFFYDDLSNLVQYIDARGVKTVLEYGRDPLNRLQSVVYDTSGVGDTSSPVSPAPKITFTYVPTGDLRRVESISTAGVSQEQRQYDSLGRPAGTRTTFSFLQGEPVLLASGYTYDSLSRLQTIKYPQLYENGNKTETIELTYRYSRDSNLIGLDLNGKAIVQGAKYDVPGMRQLNLALEAVKFTESYDYNSNGFLTKQKVTRGETEKTLLDLNYSYVPPIRNGQFETGQITVQDDLLNSSNHQSFQYDGLGRLTGSQVGLGRLTGSQVGKEPLTAQTYEYDENGNRTNVKAAEYKAGPRRGNWVPLPQQQADGVSVTIDAATNRISSPDYRYDVAGNLIQGPNIAGQPQRYLYDAAGRLVRVESSTGELIEAYQYGADRRRIGVSSNLKDWRLSYWDGYTELARYDKPESEGLTWQESPVYFGERMLGDMRRNQKGMRFFHPDQRGTALVSYENTNGQIETTRISLLPFGKERTTSAQATINRLFTSYERSNQTGLDYAINRFYDSKQGRFIQPDPLGLGAISLAAPQSLNSYSYVLNDPVNKVDSLGLKETIVRAKRIRVVAFASDQDTSYWSWKQARTGNGQASVSGVADRDTTPSNNIPHNQPLVCGGPIAGLAMNTPVALAEKFFIFGATNVEAHVGATIAAIPLGYVLLIDQLTGERMDIDPRYKKNTIYGIVQGAWNDLYSHWWDQSKFSINHPIKAILGGCLPPEHK